MQTKGSIKSLPCRGLLLSVFELLKLGVVAKLNIEMALKSRSYILDLDRVQLSLGIFFFLSCLMKSFFYQLSASTVIFVKKHTPKSRKFNVWPNFTCGKGSLVVPWSAIKAKWQREYAP